MSLDATSPARGAHRFILHVDLDQFVVAVELIAHPELVGAPVIVGSVGDPARRGVVVGASYEARRYGVRSGMALRTARRRCPAAVFLAPDFPAYRAASAEFLAVLERAPGRLAPGGWDEAYLEVETGEPEALARAIQRAVARGTGLRCSVGIGDNLLRAKVASGLAKPGGVRRLVARDWDETMGGRRAVELWGIGPATARRLSELGIKTVGALARASPEELAARFGPRIGPHLVALARGEGPARVPRAIAPARSHGHAVTFQEDIERRAALVAVLDALARAVAADLERAHRRARRIVVTVRLAPFETHSHGHPLPAPSAQAEALVGAARDALRELAIDRPVRLLGVRAELEPLAGAPAATP